jgi:hypothetical protein
MSEFFRKNSDMFTRDTPADKPQEISQTVSEVRDATGRRFRVTPMPRGEEPSVTPEDLVVVALAHGQIVLQAAHGDAAFEAVFTSLQTFAESLPVPLLVVRGIAHQAHPVSLPVRPAAPETLENGMSHPDSASAASQTSDAHLPSESAATPRAPHGHPDNGSPLPPGQSALPSSRDSSSH